MRARYRRQRFPRHTHDRYVVAVNERGAHSSFFRGSNVLIPERTLAIIPPGEVHSGEQVAGVPWHYRGMYVPASLMAEAAGREDNSPHYAVAFRQMLICDAALVDEFLAAHRLCECGGNAFEAQSAISHVLWALVGQYGQIPPHDEPVATPDCLDRVVEFLHDNFSRHIGLDDCARVANLSRFYFLRQFKRRFGLPPYAYLSQLRIERAKRMLEEGTPLSWVAAATGFVDQSHLHRLFRRLVGVTPGTYAGAMARRGDRRVTAPRQ
ncbi:MAG: helix-turn-helix domain-containing protein [Gemmatimonadaceae bacterium]